MSGKMGLCVLRSDAMLPLHIVTAWTGDWWQLGVDERDEGPLGDSLAWSSSVILPLYRLRDCAGASHWLWLNERDIDSRLGASLTTFLLDGPATTWSVSRSLAMMGPFCKDCSLCRVIVCPDGRWMSVFLESIAKPVACSWFRCMAYTSVEARQNFSCSIGGWWLLIKYHLRPIPWTCCPMPRSLRAAIAKSSSLDDAARWHRLLLMSSLTGNTMSLCSNSDLSMGHFGESRTVRSGWGTLACMHVSGAVGNAGTSNPSLLHYTCKKKGSFVWKCINYMVVIANRYLSPTITDLSWLIICIYTGCRIFHWKHLNNGFSMKMLTPGDRDKDIWL